MVGSKCIMLIHVRVLILVEKKVLAIVVYTSILTKVCPSYKFSGYNLPAKRKCTCMCILLLYCMFRICIRCCVYIQLLHSKPNTGYLLFIPYTLCTINIFVDVIHTVGPVGYNPGKLEDCYDKCLSLMKDNELTSIVSSLLCRV